MTEDMQFVCIVCEGVEECPPGTEPPIPAVCPTCAQLILADLLIGTGVSA
ncbi:hypothetical protein ACIBK9_04905 [Nonomuraea sp. NPDC050227]